MEEVEWVQDLPVDKTTLPALNHILFVAITRENEDEFEKLIREYGKGVRNKYIKNLGALIICESEELALDWFYFLKEEPFICYPFDYIPNFLKLDHFRCEYAFMTGVRFKRDTEVAERFIFRHLGLIKHKNEEEEEEQKFNEVQRKVSEEQKSEEKETK